MNDLRDAMHRAAAAVVPSPDLEDVYRRANRRTGASHRAGWSLLVVLLAAGVLVPVLVLGADHLSHAKPGGSTTTSTPTRHGPGALAPAVRLSATYKVVPLLMASAGDKFYGLVLPLSCTDSAVVVRIESGGALTRRTLVDPLACYFSELAATNSALYLGTQVIEKFTDAKNELVRVDTSTLHATARTRLPEGVVGIVTSPGSLWVATATEILRLDPITLAVRASYHPAGTKTPPLGGPYVSSLAVGAGGVWVTIGDSRHTVLERLHASTLVPLSRVHVPESGQGIGVTANADAVWLVGQDFLRPVAPGGELGHVTRLSELVGATPEGGGLIVLVGKGSTDNDFVCLSNGGRAVARSDVGDTGTSGTTIVTSGREVWLLGSSLERWRLLCTPTP